MRSCHSAKRRALLVVLALLLLALASPPSVAPASAAAVPNPCDLPGVGKACGLPGDIIGGVAGAAGDAVMRGVTNWVVNAAVWLLGELGDVIESSTKPHLQSGWFTSQYGVMAGIAGLLAMPMLLLAIIQGVVRQDWWMLARAALGYLPLAFVLTGVAVATTQMLLTITDGLSDVVSGTLGGDSRNFLHSVARTFGELGDKTGQDAVPLFGLFLGAFVIVAGAFFLWLELIVRDAVVYVAVFFLPLAFVAMIWPATGRYARKLIEVLIAVILSKFVIVAIISLAAKALAESLRNGSFEALVAGSALMLLAAFSPFALMRFIPMAEAAVASSIHRSGAGVGTASSVFNSTPAMQMRRAMNANWYGGSGGGLRVAPAGAAAGGAAAGGAVAVAGAGVATAGRAARERVEQTAAFRVGDGASPGGGRSGSTASRAAAPPVSGDRGAAASGSPQRTPGTAGGDSGRAASAPHAGGRPASPPSAPPPSAAPPPAKPARPDPKGGTDRG